MSTNTAEKPGTLQKPYGISGLGTLNPILLERWAVGMNGFYTSPAICKLHRLTSSPKSLRKFQQSRKVEAAGEVSLQILLPVEYHIYGLSNGTEWIDCQGK